MHKDIEIVQNVPPNEAMSSEACGWNEDLGQRSTSSFQGQYKQENMC